MVIRVFEGCAGYGSTAFAFKMNNIKHEIVGYSEIDKYAQQIYENNHGNVTNYGDITKIIPEELPDFDLFTAGFPCQAFSIAGKRGGFTDTRGTMIHDILRIANIKKPQYLILENVKGLLSHDDGDTFKVILKSIKDIGYDVIWSVLNTRDYGIPQNRERVWIVCKLGRWDFMEFQFPQKKELKLRVKDILEPEVDDKYILSEKMVKTILSRNRKKGFDVSPSLTSNMAKGNECTPIFPLSKNISKPYRVYDSNGCFPTINTRDLPSISTNQRVNPEIAHTLTPGANSTGLHSDMDIFMVGYTRDSKGKVESHHLKDISGTIHPPSGTQQEFILQISRGNNQGGIHSTCPTITSNSFENNNYLFSKSQFRRLTPRECFRLMGFLNDEINISGISNAQLYKLAGNGQDVNLLSKLISSLYKS